MENDRTKAALLQRASKLGAIVNVSLAHELGKSETWTYAQLSNAEVLRGKTAIVRVFLGSDPTKMVTETVAMRATGVDEVVLAKAVERALDRFEAADFTGGSHYERGVGAT